MQKQQQQQQQNVENKYHIYSEKNKYHIILLKISSEGILVAGANFHPLTAQNP